MIVRDYYHRLTNRKKLISCIRCQERLKPSFMNRHMQINHSINIKNICVWCLSPVHHLSNSYEHRIECFKQRYQIENDGVEFSQKNTLSQPDWCVDKTSVNGFAFNSIEISTWLTNRISCAVASSDNAIFESINPEMPYPDWLTDHTGVSEDKLRYFLNKFPMDMALTGFDPFLQLAFTYKENVVWLHLFIYADHWQFFLKFLKRFCGNIYFLPHWRVCSERSKYHRHSLAVILKFSVHVFLSEFEKEFVCYGSVAEILNPRKSPIHLISTIEYLGNCKQFSSNQNQAHYFRKLQSSHLSTKLYHSNVNDDARCVINQSVIPYATLFAMLYIPLGINHYMSAYHAKEKFWLYPIKKSRRGWEIECIKLSGVKQIIFPLPRNMEFVEIINEFESDSFLFVGYQIFTYKQNDLLLALDQIQWNFHQANTKNFLLDVLGDFTYRPDSKQQYILNAIAEATENLKSELIHEKIAKDSILNKYEQLVNK